MSIQYFVPCTCGRKIPVETRQAGEAIACDCGATLVIPRLLELKKLEKVAVQADVVKPRTAWGLGQGLILSGAMLLLVVVVLGFLVIYYTPSDPHDRMTPDQLRAETQRMTPSQTWQTWQYFLRTGINPRKPYAERYFEGLLAQSQLLLTFLGIAAAGSTAIIVVGVLLARRKRPARSPATN